MSSGGEPAFLSLLAQGDGGAPPWMNPQFLFLIVAGIIWLVTQVVSVVPEYQKRSAAAHRQREKQVRVEFEGVPAPEFPAESPPLSDPLPESQQPSARTPATRRSRDEPGQPRLMLGRPPDWREPAPVPRPVKRLPSPVLPEVKPRASTTVLSPIDRIKADPERLREAMVLREILGPPMVYRRRRGNVRLD